MDACSRCQLACPSCPTGRRENAKGIVGWGALSLQDFISFCERHPHVRHIELSNWGELFLNPELVPMMRYAHEHGILLNARNGANLNTVRQEVLAALVQHRFHVLSVSLDGASQETYAQYRRNGDFDRVIAHVKTINEHKARARSRYPCFAGSSSSCATTHTRSRRQRRWRKRSAWNSGPSNAGTLPWRP
ncbi:hypothetical protein AUJ68_06225 [Candidatus Woesearchaeota archaeon CG1_02_57_44]|nr:MAG: hypothetical protein AUJ68_06225 [Candidatus Woesearchaeota archaeon CG1_02_57_44]